MLTTSENNGTGEIALVSPNPVMYSTQSMPWLSIPWRCKALGITYYSSFKRPNISVQYATSGHLNSFPVDKLNLPMHVMQPPSWQRKKWINIFVPITILKISLWYYRSTKFTIYVHFKSTSAAFTKRKAQYIRLWKRLAISYRIHSRD